MKKLAQRILIDLPPVRLYLDDLEEIETILKSEFKRLKIRSEGFELSSVSELREFKKDKVKDLDISVCDSFYMYLSLNKGSARISSEQDDIRVVGIIEKIKQIVTRKSSVFKFMRWKDLLLIHLVISAVCGLLLAKFLVSLMSPGPSGFLFGGRPIYMGALLSFFAIVDFLLYRLAFRSYSVIYLLPKNESPGFLKRNKDQLLVAFISALIGAIAALVLPALFR